MRMMTHQEQKAHRRLVDSSMGRIEKLNNAEEAQLEEALRPYFQELAICDRQYAAVSRRFRAIHAELHWKHPGKWVAFHSEAEFYIAETAEEALAWRAQRGYDSDSVVVKHIWPGDEIRGFRPFRMKMDRVREYQR